MSPVQLKSSPCDHHPDSVVHFFYENSCALVHWACLYYGIFHIYKIPYGLRSYCILRVNSHGPYILN